MIEEDILNCPMVENDGNAATIREYFAELLSTLWFEGEGFSGKRPLGNSDWQWNVYISLSQAGLINSRSAIDEDGYIDFDMAYEEQKRVDKLIAKAIRWMCNHG